VNGARADCPVPTCVSTMPAGQVMCTRCWGRVPKSLRSDIDGSKVDSSRRQEKLRQAIAAAQSVTS
jgi:hypothetical protein